MPNLRWPKLKIAFVFTVLFTATACKAPQTDAPQEPSSAMAGETPVANVNGTYIYESDIARFAARIGLVGEGELEAGTPMFAEALEALIDQRLLSQDGAQLALDEQPETQRKLSIARDRILSASRAESHLTEIITQEAVRAEYDKQKSLGRTQSFADSRDDIERLMRAQAIDDLIQTLRDDADIQFLGDDKDKPEMTPKATEE